MFIGPGLSRIHGAIDPWEVEGWDVEKSFLYSENLSEIAIGPRYLVWTQKNVEEVHKVGRKQWYRIFRDILRNRDLQFFVLHTWIRFQKECIVNALSPQERGLEKFQPIRRRVGLSGGGVCPHSRHESRGGSTLRLRSRLSALWLVRTGAESQNQTTQRILASSQFLIP